MATLSQPESDNVAGRPVWPEGQKIRFHGNEQTLLQTRFEDWQEYHPALLSALEAIHRSEATPFRRRYIAAFGGTKIEAPERWNVPQATLVARRAMAFCTTALSIASAQLMESWANIYRDGDYAMPHSHPGANASLLYIVDPGRDEPAPEDPLAGLFAIVDPRYAACCETQKGFVTNPVMPKIPPGTMLLFPGWLVHAVNPHTGPRPRITMTWNIRTTDLSDDDPNH